MLILGSHTVRVSKSPRNIRIASHHGGLSHFGGAYFFHEFERVLHIRHFLAEQIRYPGTTRTIAFRKCSWLWSIPSCLDWIASRRRPSYVLMEPFTTPCPKLRFSLPSL